MISSRYHNNSSMVSISIIIILLTFSLLSPLTTQISNTSIKNAIEILSNSGFFSMSLTLPLISTSFFSTLPSSTLFTPFDTSFSLSGQPSFSLLQFHVCPRFYSYSDLQYLSYGDLIPTLNPNFSLSITSSTFDDEVFINGVKIVNPPIFDDGFLIVYAIDHFFNPNFTTELTPSPVQSYTECTDTNPNGYFQEASNKLRSEGYSLMAAFLDLQLIQFGSGNDEKVLTVFAPKDVAMEGQMGNFSNSGRVLLRYVIGCGLNWGELVELNDGFILNTLLKGFKIKITRNITNGSNDNDKSSFSLTLNGQVSVEIPDLYRNERIVVHGLSGVLGQESGSGHDGYPPVNVRQGVEHVEF